MSCARRAWLCSALQRRRSSPLSPARSARGDSGQRCPPDRPAYGGADSRRLLAEVRAAVEEAGYRPENVDSTLIAERPKLAPHLPRMRQAIGEALGLNAARGNVKATTNEGVGAIGPREGA